MWLGLLAATAGPIASWSGLTATTVTLAGGAVLAAALITGFRRPVQPTTTAAAVARGPATDQLVDRLADDGLDVEELRRMFLGAVSHELRTPVTSMVGYAQTILEHHRTLTPYQLHHFADRLVANGRRLEELILDLLELHPGSFVDSRPVPRPVDLTAVLDELVEGHRDGRHVARLRSTVGTVLLDEHKLRRIVSELLDNVVRHTPDGTRVDVAAAHHDGTVLVLVEDDGPGLDPAIASAVAEPFVQGRHVAGDAAPGLGIGLALAVRYAELCGGHVDLGASSSGGTRACVVLPTGAAPTEHAPLDDVPDVA